MDPPCGYCDLGRGRNFVRDSRDTVPADAFLHTAMHYSLFFKSSVEFGKELMSTQLTNGSKTKLFKQSMTQKLAQKYSLLMGIL